MKAGSEPEFMERIAVCMNCEQFRPRKKPKGLDHCERIAQIQKRVCGCGLIWKWWRQGQGCPESKW